MENSGQQKKMWVTYKAFLTDHNMAIHKPSSTVSDLMTFCKVCVCVWGGRGVCNQ